MSVVIRRDVSGQVTIANKGLVKIKNRTPIPRTIRLYGRYFSETVVVDPRIDYSIDGVNYTASNDLVYSEQDDPTYDLLVTYTNVTHLDIWIRPTNSDPSYLLLGDQISQTGAEAGDYPYSYSNPYQYSIHNGGVYILDDVDLYFQLAVF